MLIATPLNAQQAPATPPITHCMPEMQGYNFLLQNGYARLAAGNQINDNPPGTPPVVVEIWFRGNNPSQMVVINVMNGSRCLNNTFKDIQLNPDLFNMITDNLVGRRT